MKTIKNTIIVLALSCFIVSCKKENQPEVKTVEVAEVAKAEANPNAIYNTAEFTIEGMTCAVGCAKTIEKKLSNLEGVKSAKVDFDKKLATVEYDTAKLNPENLTSTVKKAGDVYIVKEMKTYQTHAAKKECSKDCKKPCCANKKDCDVKCSPDCTKKDCEKCAAKKAACKKKCETKKINCTKNGNSSSANLKTCTKKAKPTCKKEEKKS